MKPLPKLVMLTVALLSGAVGLSALAFGVASLLLGEKPYWMIFGFEIVTMVAAVIGVLFARGKFQEGQGMALACVAATFAVSAFLGWLSAQGQLQIKGSATPVGLDGWLAARVGAALVIGALGAYAVLSRSPRSRPYLLWAMLTGGPVVVAMGAGFVARGRLESMLQSMPAWLTTALAGILGITVVVLLSAAGHCLIRAFEMGRAEKA